MDIKSVGAQTFHANIEPHMEPLPDTPEVTKIEQDQGGLASVHHDRKIDEMLSKSLDEINKKLALMSNEMRYSYHKPTRTISVKVINTETDEVVREIPPQGELDALAKMWELAGILVDEKG